MDFEVIVVGETNPCGNKELFHASDKWVHLGVSHHRACFGDTASSNEEYGWHYLWGLVETASIATLQILDLSVA